MDPVFLIELIARQLGLTDAQLGITLLFVVLVSNLASRLIPDDSTGWLGLVHKLTKIVGLYASNRISKGVTTTTAVKAMLPDEFFAAPQVQTHEVPVTVEVPGPERSPDGKFKKSQTRDDSVGG